MTRARTSVDSTAAVVAGVEVRSDEETGYCGAVAALVADTGSNIAVAASRAAAVRQVTDARSRVRTACTITA